MEQYRPRIVDEELAARLGSAGVVLIEGPRACGKTATGRHHAASEVLLDVDAGLRHAAELEPGLVLEGSAPRLIDEWQTVPSIWNHARRAVDLGGGTGRFILTGSAVPPDDTTRHTGAGRMSRLSMRPMSLFESGHSTGEMSLGAMLRGEPVPAQHSRTTVTDLVELVCRGGWPGMIGAATNDAQRFVRDYLEEIRRTDIRRLDGIRRDPVLVRRVLQSLARIVATEAASPSRSCYPTEILTSFVPEPLRFTTFFPTSESHRRVAWERVFFSGSVSFRVPFVPSPSRTLVRSAPALAA